METLVIDPDILPAKGVLHFAATRSEQRYRAVSHTNGQIVLVTNAAGEVVDPQDHWAEFTGQSLAEYSGLGWTTAMHPQDREGSLRRVESGMPATASVSMRVSVAGPGGQLPVFFDGGQPDRLGDGNGRGMADGPHGRDGAGGFPMSTPPKHCGN